MTRDDVKPGMTVRSSDGQRLGQVRATGEAGFELDGAEHLPDVRYAEVSYVAGGEVVMGLSAAEVRAGVHSGGQIRGEPGAPEFSGAPPSMRPSPDALRSTGERKT